MRILTCLVVVSLSSGVSASETEPMAPDTSVIEPCHHRGHQTASDVVLSRAADHLDSLFDISLSNYWPGLNGSVWVSRSDDRLYAVRDLRILKDSLVAVGQAHLSIYDRTGQRIVDEPVLDLHAMASSKGLLLTGFFDPASGLQCLDLLMAAHSRSSARASRLYFNESGTLQSRTLDFRRLLSVSAQEWQ